MNLKRFSRTIAVILAALLMVSGSVFAAPATTESIIDTNRTGSITVIKYENERNEAEDTDPGLGTTAGASSQQHRPLADVTYTIYRVADIVQGHLDSTGTSVSVEYRSLVKDSAGHTIDVPSMVKDGRVMDKDEAVAVLNRATRSVLKRCGTN